MSNSNLPTQYQQFIHLSRYSRFIAELNRRETFTETVERLENFYTKHLKEKYSKTKISSKELRSIFDPIYSLDVLPSMRALMAAGPAAEGSEVSLYNCSYTAIDHQVVFSEILFILMNGTGVGFSVERQEVNKLPEIPEKLHTTETSIIVEDSKLGWAKALKQLVAMLYAGEIPKWDDSNLREAGAILKTFGGRSSGPEPLRDLYNFFIKIFKQAVGRKLSSLECHDLVCMIGNIVVVGGVRRSALISLSNLSDLRLRDAKSGEWWKENDQRKLSNNSVAYTEKPEVGQFMEEWMALYKSHSGERGIFNRQSAKRYADLIGRDSNFDFGTNPCVTGETPILTDYGYVNIKDVIGTPTNIWNGEEFSEVVPFSTGINSIYRVTLSDGSHLDCTPYHKWCIEGEMIETTELSIGDKLDKFKMPIIHSGENDSEIDAYSQGFYSGDGNKNRIFSWVYSPKYECMKSLVGTFKDSVEGRKLWKHGNMLPKNFVPTESFEYKLKWLAGILDSDGTVTRDENGNGFQICSTDHEFLIDMKLMLTTIGVCAKIVSSNPAGFRRLPNGKGGHKDYDCKKVERLLIGNSDSYDLMALGLGKYLNRLKHNGVKPQRDARQFVRVVSVDDLNYCSETFCFTEPKTSRGTFNGIVTGQCGEIILRSGQFCNLTEAVARPNDTKETLSEKIRIATIIGTIQSSFTDFKYLRKKWKDNCEEERLLGVSITGIMDCPLLMNVNDETKALLTHLRKVARDTNNEWADRLGIQRSTAITAVKPSGTASQLVDSASGIHTRYAHNYIRRVRQDVKDPLTKFMIDKGFPNEVDVRSKDIIVFSFPMSVPEGSIVENVRGPIETLEHWKMFKEFYCDHNPSTTVSVPESSWPEVGAWVWNNFDNLTGLSFLPEDLGTYKQSPYERVTTEVRQELDSQIPKDVNWLELESYESEDMTSGSQELACVAGLCAI